MKKLLLIVGIILIVACIISLLIASIYYSAYRNLRDSTAEHYARLHRKAIVFLATGVVLAVIGAVCIVI